jgi:Fe-S-cluster containining protein
MTDCEKCGGTCCKVVYFAAKPEHIEFVKTTRTCYEVPFGLLMPSRCQHLGEDNKCQIYETRPQICRDFEVGSYFCRMMRETCGDG